MVYWPPVIKMPWKACWLPCIGKTVRFLRVFTVQWVFFKICATKLQLRREISTVKRQHTAAVGMVWQLNTITKEKDVPHAKTKRNSRHYVGCGSDIVITTLALLNIKWSGSTAIARATTALVSVIICPLLHAFSQKFPITRSKTTCEMHVTICERRVITCEMHVITCDFRTCHVEWKDMANELHYILLEFNRFKIVLCSHDQLLWDIFYNKYNCSRRWYNKYFLPHAKICF